MAEGTAVNDHFIQGKERRLLPLGEKLAFQHHPIFHVILACKNPLQRLLRALGFAVRQVTQMTAVHCPNRHIRQGMQIPHSTQHRAITADSHCQLCRCQPCCICLTAEHGLMPGVADACHQFLRTGLGLRIGGIRNH